MRHFVKLLARCSYRVIRQLTLCESYLQSWSNVCVCVADMCRRLEAFRAAFGEKRLMLQLKDFEGDLISLKKQASRLGVCVFVFTCVDASDTRVQTDLEYSMLHRKAGVAITLVGTVPE